MKYLNDSGLHTLVDVIKGDLSNFTGTVIPTFEEVYNNLFQLDEVIGHHNEGDVTDEYGIHGIRYRDGVFQVVSAEYEQATPEAGADPSALGLYELINGEYVLTTDTSVVNGKTYYSKEIAWEDVDTGSGGTTIVTIPTVSVGTYTYNGTEQGPTIGTYSRNLVHVTDAKKVNAGTYTLTLSLANTENMIWSDLTIADKTFQYTIDKADASITLSKSSVVLNADTLTDTVTIEDSVGGEVSVLSNNTSVATAMLSGSTITIESPNEETGTTTVTVSIPASENYNAASENITVSAEFSQIFGVSWSGGSETTWSRTDAAADFTNPVPAVSNGNGSSPFDDYMPWSGMKRVTDATGGVLVEIPKFWYKWTRSGSTMKLQISNGPEEGFLVSPGHADRGDGKGERDKIYVGAYHCDSSYKSTSGVKPKASITRSAARTGIHNLGADYWQWDYATLWTIRMLYLVEYADWNSQKVIGYGCGNNSGTENAGLCDAMVYHTGTNASSRTTYGHTRYRYIEDLWGNVYDWCDGIYFSSSNIYCIKNPANFSDSANGTNVGTRATSSNYISAWSNPTVNGFEYALYPTAVSGSDSTYVADYCNYGASGVVLLVGGYYNQSQYHGLFCMYGSSAASSSYGYLGSRLQKLP